MWLIRDSTPQAAEERVRKDLESLLDQFFSPSATNEQRLKLSKTLTPSPLCVATYPI